MRMIRTRDGANWRVIGLGLLALMLPAAAHAAPASILCRNTTSGATWTIVVDSAAQTVDGVPARVSPILVSWHDAGGHFYDLHTQTGLLEMHAASSTGGFYLEDRCATGETAAAQ